MKHNHNRTAISTYTGLNRYQKRRMYFRTFNSWLMTEPRIQKTRWTTITISRFAIEPLTSNTTAIGEYNNSKTRRDETWSNPKASVWAIQSLESTRSISRIGIDEKSPRKANYYTALAYKLDWRNAWTAKNWNDNQERRKVFSWFPENTTLNANRNKGENERHASKNAGKPPHINWSA